MVYLLNTLCFHKNMSLTTPLIFQVHAVPERIALCWPASIEGQVLKSSFVTKSVRLAQDSRFKIQDPKKTS